MTDFDMGEAPDLAEGTAEGTFTSEALEATERADAALEAQEEIAGFITENWDEIADGEVSTESLWENYDAQFGKADEGKALEGAELLDAQLEAQEEIAGFITENWDEIAEGEVSTEPLWEAYQDQFGKAGEVDTSKAFANLDPANEPEASPEPPEPEPPAEVDPPAEPQPGDLNWTPSSTGVQYPDPERMEGNVGGPEKLG